MNFSNGYSISASLMCADLLNIKRDLEFLKEGEVEFLHCDVMDGHFVNNITLGIDFCVKVANATSIKRDIHFLTDNPINFIDRLHLKKGELVSVHFESNSDISKMSKKVRVYNAKFGVAVNPSTKVEELIRYLDQIDFIVLMMIEPGFAGQPLIPGMIDKIKECKKMLISEGNSKILIEVDGHVGFDNMKEMQDNGADIFVAGTSSIFRKSDNILNNIKKVRTILSNRYE